MSNVADQDDNVVMKRKRQGDQEMDLAILFRAIWNTRKLVIGVAFATALGLFGLIAFSRLAIPTTQLFQHAVQFVFPGVEKGEYPSGATFSAFDLLAPAVLEEVYRQNDLVKYGIKMGDFASAISLHPYAPGYSAALLRFSARLGNKKLSFVERKQIEQQMDKELSDILRKGVRLRLTVKKRLAFSDILADKLLHDIARQWALFSIKQRGVLKLADATSGSPIVDKAVLLKSEPLFVTTRLQEESDRLLKKLNRLHAYSGANTIVDRASGMTIADLQHQINLFIQYGLANLQIKIVVGKHYKDRPAILGVLSQRRDFYSLIKQNNENKAGVIESSLRLYANRQSLGGRLSAAGSTENTNMKDRSSDPAPQLGEGFIDRLIDLTNQEGDVAYRQGLINRLVTVKNAAVEAAKKEKELSLLIGKIEGSADSAKERSRTVSRKELGVQLGQVSEKLNDFGTITGRLFEMMSQKRISYLGELYVPVELPGSEKVKINHPIFNKSVLIILVLVSLAMAIFAMFAGLIWQMMRGYPRSA